MPLSHILTLSERSNSADVTKGGHTISTQLPPNLPDARTAQRLLDVLAQLEQALRNGRHANSAAHTGLETRMANLEFENRRLRTARQQATERLDALLERMKEQLATSAQTAVQEDAA